MTPHGIPAQPSAPSVSVVRVLPLTAIQFTAQNPRTDAAVDLDELTASMAAVQEPYVAQLPIVQEMAPDTWRVIAGERRIRAVTAAGWQTVACLVYRRLDAATAHTLRVVENLHHKPLHLYDEGVALKLAWLMANARALNLTAEAQAILAHEQPPSVALEQLTACLRERGFLPTRPVVTWDAVLNTLGLDLSPAARKRRVRLVSVDHAIQAQAHDLHLSAAAMGAIGTLPETDQQRFLSEVAADPALAKKARRIARTVRDQSYTLDQAVAEARGQVLLSDSGDGGGPTDAAALGSRRDQERMRAEPIRTVRFPVRTRWDHPGATRVAGRYAPRNPQCARPSRGGSPEPAPQPG